MKEKILIIEDDPMIQIQLKNLLTGNGYEVEAVTDFTNPVEHFRVFAPHLVLLDIKLPGSSGFEICTQIRAFSDLPIIFVTSSNTDMDELNSIMLGGDAFITKPYNPAILLAKIASLLRKAGASSQAAEVLIWNGAELHLESSTIAYDGEEVELTILDQIVSNAVKYRAPQQPALHISAERADDRVLLSIADNGVGIPESDLPRIFEKGFTGQNGRTIHSSTGIGLYLCKRLCDKLGIGLAASSTGRGTTITLSFHINDFITGVQG